MNLQSARRKQIGCALTEERKVEEILATFVFCRCRPLDVVTTQNLWFIYYHRLIAAVALYIL